MYLQLLCVCVVLHVEMASKLPCFTCYMSGPSWLKNLYFAYLLTLRAIVKAEPHWAAYLFYTGDQRQDQETKEQVTRLIHAAKYV